MNTNDRMNSTSTQLLQGFRQALDDSRFANLEREKEALRQERDQAITQAASFQRQLQARETRYEQASRGVIELSQEINQLRQKVRELASASQTKCAQVAAEVLGMIRAAFGTAVSDRADQLDATCAHLLRQHLEAAYRDIEEAIDAAAANRLCQIDRHISESPAVATDGRPVVKL